MANNEDTVTELDIEVEDTDISEPEKTRELELVLDVVNSTLRVIVLSIIILIMLMMETTGSPEFSTMIISFFTGMLPMVLLFTMSGTAVRIPGIPIT